MSLPSGKFSLVLCLVTNFRVLQIGGNHIIQWFSNLVCIRISWGFRILQTGDSETILEGESGNLHRIYIPDDADAVG